jgi:hypothetical protein
LWYTLRSTPASERTSWQVGERQVQSQHNYGHNNDQANEHVKISSDFYADEDAYQKADGSKDYLTLRHRIAPPRFFSGQRTPQA